jgi:prepilin-type N-terminal cleavage/methylation domain-containing protein
MTRPRSPKGLSLVELLIGIVILGVIGMSLTKVMLSQARYFDHQKQADLARNVSRGPLNRVVSDIRMVEASGGVTAASSTSITARVPYAVGVVCNTTGSSTTVSLLPVDSAMYATGGYSGYAWRNTQGQFIYVMTTTLPSTGDVSTCTASGISTLTSAGAKVIAITPAIAASGLDTADIGTPVFLLRKLTYEFKASTAVPGTTGLYRTVVDAGTTEELSAPYASSAAFKFFVGSSLVAQTNAPSDLSTLRGLELNMTGMSENKARGSTTQTSAPFVTAVFFKNRLN